MPDLQNFSRTFLGASNVNVPRVQISAQITDSTTGAVLADFTGANVIIFPAVLSTLSAAQRQKIADMIATTLVLMRGGFDDGTA